MKTVVVFYSYSGKTKAIAEELAKKESASLVEIKDKKTPIKLKAFVMGCFAAIRGKAWAIRPLGVDLKEFDRIILLSPIWAGNPPPAFNAALELLPEGKTVSFKMVSSSGQCGCKERLEAAVKVKGGSVEGFENIKA